RAVRAISRLVLLGLLQLMAVVVPDDRRAVAALRPVAAGGVAARGGEAPRRIGPGEDVVLVRRVAAALDRLALLGQRRLLGDVGVLRMQVVQVLRHDDALGIAPRALADAIARAHAGVAAGERGAQ